MTPVSVAPRAYAARVPAVPRATDRIEGASPSGPVGDPLRRPAPVPPPGRAPVANVQGQTLGRVIDVSA